MPVVVGTDGIVVDGAALAFTDGAGGAFKELCSMKLLGGYAVDEVSGVGMPVSSNTAFAPRVWVPTSAANPTAACIIQSDDRTAIFVDSETGTVIAAIAAAVSIRCAAVTADGHAIVVPVEGAAAVISADGAVRWTMAYAGAVVIDASAADGRVDLITSGAVLAAFEGPDAALDRDPAALSRVDVTASQTVVANAAALRCSSTVAAIMSDSGDVVFVSLPDGVTLRAVSGVSALCRGVGDADFILLMAKSDDGHQKVVQASVSGAAGGKKKAPRTSTGGRKSAEVLPVADLSSAVVATVVLPSSKLTSATSLACVGGAIIVVGRCANGSEVAALWCPLSQEGTIVDPSLSDAARWHTAAAVDSAATATLHYVAPVVQQVAAPSTSYVVSAVRAAPSVHARRGRSAAEAAALSAVLAAMPRAALRLPGPGDVPPQWNHAVLRAALKRAGANTTLQMVDEASATLKKTPSWFEGVTASSNVISAAVTLQRQLAIRLPLPTADDADASSVVVRAVAKKKHRQAAQASAQDARTDAMAAYAASLASARSVGVQASRIAGRWDAVLATQDAAASLRMHGPGASIGVKISAADTIAEKLAAMIAQLPPGANAPGCIFGDAAAPAQSHAKSIALAAANMTDIELRTAMPAGRTH